MGLLDYFVVLYSDHQPMRFYETEPTKKIIVSRCRTFSKKEKFCCYGFVKRWLDHREPSLIYHSSTIVSCFMANLQKGKRQAAQFRSQLHTLIENSPNLRSLHCFSRTRDVS
uniref:Reverse transcriptase RNase H-like domain-containing protein n=1 Tax=Parascaris univalens TaxID=6257 RepID=A0A915A028_PARUN